MKKLLPATLLLCLLNAHAQQPRVFSGYEEFYASLPDRLFTGEGEDIAVSSRHSVRIDGREHRFRRAIAFPGESVYPDDLGRSATLYRSAGHYCVDGIGATSGTGSRHISVYLIDRNKGRSYKLPSLFGSCRALSRSANGVGFLRADIVNYRAAYDADGVLFSEHVLADDKFLAGSRQLEVRFVEPDNFYRFRLMK
ncbi:hypothetical protein [Herbaspirillum robiniae]|uniref:Uncharacterized protein n=1 Tax=Herbaspirillum robiniae TaxID=2014887 RepID=A0A246WQJ0_9BURK|nr:hypothetical protein [Herbaspirillum robiniae]OWY28645.1 hypothetical protein CEJ42_11675 [Herbaspirillum robiniae]